MAATTKDFDPIRGDYAFFQAHATQGEADIEAYLPSLEGLRGVGGPVQMLDFGCGSGNFTAQLLERAGLARDRIQLTLVEPVETYRKQAAESLRAFTAHPVAAFSSLPQPAPAAFDFALANHVLYYVSDLDAGLRGILQALAPGGVFLIAIAGEANVLIQIWLRAFALIGEPVPYHWAQHVEAALRRLGASFESRQAPYELTFADNEENRLKILRFLLGDWLPRLPRPALLDLFAPYVRDGQVRMATHSEHFHVRDNRQRCPTSMV
jgi:trans-aconitate 2-methyltransferase